MLIKTNRKMTCGNGPPGVTSQCEDLQQYYSQWYRTGCKNKNTCSPGWYRYWKFSKGCFPAGGWNHNCCAKVIPDHNPQSDFQCCVGNVVAPKTHGYCNLDSCPYSDYCNQYMQRICPLRGNLESWFGDKGNCSTYVTESKNSTVKKVRTASARIVRQTIENNFPGSYKPGDINEYFPLRVKMAKEACSAYPEECNSTLNRWCKTVTREDVSKSPELLTLCGCHMPDNQYPYSGFVSPPCAMTCNNRTAIQTGGDLCKQTVCIIDDVDINMVDSEGNVNLKQICSGEGEGSSVCLLKDINVNAINSRVGSGGVTVEQQCSRCYKWQGTSGDGTEILKSHPGFDSPEGWIPPPGWVETPCQGSGGGLSGSTTRKWVIIGLIILVLVILAMLALLLLVA